MNITPQNRKKFLQGIFLPHYIIYLKPNKAHDSVSEGAVVSIPHEIKGETTVAFVILKKVQGDTDEIRNSISGAVARDIAKFAVPAKIVFVEGLPKTRSGD